MIDHEKLLDLIRKEPGVRTVQLCDRLDADIDELTDALKREIRAGVVRQQEVIGPNNRKALAFWLVGAKPAAVMKPPVPATRQAPVHASMPKSRTKVEIALEFLRSQPDQRATSSEMRDAIGIQKPASPVAFLTTGVKDRRLAFDGKLWTIGAAAPASGSDIRVPPPLKQLLQAKLGTESPPPRLDTVRQPVLSAPVAGAAAEEIRLTLTLGISGVTKPGPDPDPDGRIHLTIVLTGTPELRAALKAGLASVRVGGGS